MSSKTSEQTLDRAISFSNAGAVTEPFSDLAEDVRRGLASNPKQIPSKYFYDEQGSNLFEEITRQPEYYPMRAEHEILEAEADRIIESCRPQQLVELGSGSSTKSRALLNAMQIEGILGSYVPVDISESIVHRSAFELAIEYPGIEITAMIGDFEKDLTCLPQSESRLIAFLGGTIGNFHPDHRVDFLRNLCGLMGQNDHLLLGTDLVKPRSQLESAYNDANGVTAEFNKNILNVINRELDGEFDTDQFKHVAFFNEELSCIEMRLRCLEDHSVCVGVLDQTIHFKCGDEIKTEISCKFTRETVEEAYEEAGLSLSDWYTDSAGRFALSTARPAG